MNFFSLNKFHVLTSLSKHLDIVIDNKIDPLNSDRTFIGWNWFSNENIFEARKKKVCNRYAWKGGLFLKLYF